MKRPAPVTVTLSPDEHQALNQKCLLFNADMGPLIKVLAFLQLEMMANGESKEDILEILESLASERKAA